MKQVSTAAHVASDHSGKNVSHGVCTESGAPASSGGGSASKSVSTAVDGFSVQLQNFDGPFDLLLSLITKHELDITEVSLSVVTDEFLQYITLLQEQGNEQALEQASEFLMIAATLLDLKLSSLLPGAQAVEHEDIAALQARDLLFARLLQYRAFKEASGWLRERMGVEEKRHGRRIALEEKYRGKRSELKWTLSLEDFAALALVALSPREVPQVRFEHLHAPLVSIREQATVLVSRLRKKQRMSFGEIIADVQQKGVIVARFLALLELYRQDAIDFEQDQPLGELFIQWVSQHWSDEQLSNLGSDYDN